MSNFKILNFALLRNGAIHCKNEIKMFSDVITALTSLNTWTFWLRQNVKHVLQVLSMHMQKCLTLCHSGSEKQLNAK